MKILIAYDGSAQTDVLLQDLYCAGLPVRANASVLTLAEPEAKNIAPAERFTGWPSRRLAKARDSARAACEQIQAAFPEWTVTSETRLSAPLTAISEKTARWQPDLVVVGGRGQLQAEPAEWGRVTRQLLAQVRCSVRVARDATRLPDQPLRLLLRLDDSPSATALIKEVAARNWPRYTQVRLVISLGTFHSGWQQVAGILGAESVLAQELTQQAAQLLQAAGLHLSSDTHIGHTALDTLYVASEWESDCIFVSLNSSQFFRQRLDSNLAAKVAARATCSVEVVRG